MSYVVASYVIVVVAVVAFGASQLRARAGLRKALSHGRNRDRS